MGLDLSIITRATNGDPQAIQTVLQYYDDYIEALSAYEVKGEDGIVHRRIG